MEVAMRINQVLAAKAQQDVITISPDATVRDLLRRLAEHNVGALVVSRDGRSVEGIVSERDVVRRLGEDEGALDAQVATIMTPDVHTCDAEHVVNDLMQLMTERRIRHVPVLNAGELVGIISIGDVVKHRLSELEFERDQLDSYVHAAQT
jgi:CBS domain-containing protein